MNAPESNGVLSARFGTATQRLEHTQSVRLPRVRAAGTACGLRGVSATSLVGQRVDAAAAASSVLRTPSSHGRTMIDPALRWQSLVVLSRPLRLWLQQR